MNESLLKAANILMSGGLVAIPTETVYGLAADATKDQAVASIFLVKNRPTFNPLIIHGHSVEMLSRYVIFNEQALRLAKAFWPGPLTLVLPRKKDSPISLLASAGLDTVAVRIPKHSLTLALLKETGLPLAAPSANASGSISPTRADAVTLDIPYVLDGGPCYVGVESTIVDVTSDRPVLLRPGGLSREDIEALVGPIDIYEGSSITAPGQLTSHYAPAIPVRLNAIDPEGSEAYLAFGPTNHTGDHVLNLSPSADLQEAAANLFHMMRTLDQSRFKGMAVAPIPNHSLGHAINDRLTRASAKR